MTEQTDAEAEHRRRLRRALAQPYSEFFHWTWGRLAVGAITWVGGVAVATAVMVHRGARFWDSIPDFVASAFLTLLCTPVAALSIFLAVWLTGRALILAGVLAGAVGAALRRGGEGIDGAFRGRW